MLEMKATLKFLFLFANDIDAIVEFYGKKLLMNVSGGSDKGWAMVKAGVDICFFKGDYELPVINEWAWQPGYGNAIGHFASWAIEFSEAEFRTVIKNIQASDTPMFMHEKPNWRKDSYWALTVRDPMGNTIELYACPAVKPDSLEWV